MKVLWFTNTPSKASPLFGYDSFGGGWISALETIVVAENKHTLGICFFYSGAEFKKVEQENVTYYGIPLQKEFALERIVNRHRGILNDNRSDLIDKVIEDFGPELVHVFGTEMGYGKLLMNKYKKVVFHLQGLVAPYSEVYFPANFTNKKAFFNSGIKDMLRGLTFYNQYILFKKRAERELEIMSNWKYYTGRTDWDKNYTYLLNPSATYFHCEELLRNDFFINEWKVPIFDIQKKTIVIGTTINPNLYKGLDLIYKVIPLLKNYTIEWKIFGINEENDLNKLVKKVLHIKKRSTSIKFYGQTSSDKLINELQLCHLFVHPSYIDNSPNSVCEAMLLGMPVISSAVGGINSLITHRETGYLFNPQDKYDLAGMIAFLINNYETAVICGTKARQVALKRHHPASILQELNTIYNTIYND